MSLPRRKQQPLQGALELDVIRYDLDLLEAALAY
jgi:hypothetical protein